MSDEQKDALMELCKVHVHSQVITVECASIVFVSPLNRFGFPKALTLKSC